MLVSLVACLLGCLLVGLLGELLVGLLVGLLGGLLGCLLGPSPSQRFHLCLRTRPARHPGRAFRERRWLEGEKKNTSALPREVAGGLTENWRVVFWLFVRGCLCCEGAKRNKRRTTLWPGSTGNVCAVFQGMPADPSHGSLKC